MALLWCGRGPVVCAIFIGVLAFGLVVINLSTTIQEIVKAVSLNRH